LPPLNTGLATEFSSVVSATSKVPPEIVRVPDSLTEFTVTPADETMLLPFAAHAVSEVPGTSAGNQLPAAPKEPPPGPTQVSVQAGALQATVVEDANPTNVTMPKRSKPAMTMRTIRIKPLPKIAHYPQGSNRLNG
jgi:hypothetical protein